MTKPSGLQRRPRNCGARSGWQPLETDTAARASCCVLRAQPRTGVVQEFRAGPLTAAAMPGALRPKSWCVRDDRGRELFHDVPPDARDRMKRGRTRALTSD